MVVWIEPDSTLIFPKYIFLLNTTLAFFAGLFMNILLLYLISKRTPKEMRSYARIMKIHCLSDMFYDFIQCATGVHPNPIGGKVFMMMQGFVTQVNLTLNFFVFEFYFWSLLFSIAILPIDFYFRYLSVCKNKDLSNKQLFIMIFLAYFITWLHAFPNALNFIIKGPSLETIEYTKELQKFQDWKHHVPSFSVTEFGSLNSILNFCFIISLNCCSYGIIAWTYVKIQKSLKENAVNNQKTNEIQKQVSRILILQASLPLFVICLPVSLICVFALAHIDLPHFGSYCQFLYLWLAAVKPTATIMIIPKYRSYLKSKFLDVCHCVGNGSSTSRVSDMTVTKSSNGMSSAPTESVSDNDNHYF